MCRFGPFDIHRVVYFGIDIASILRAPTRCWTEHSVSTKFGAGLNIGGCFGVAIDTLVLTAVQPGIETKPALQIMIIIILLLIILILLLLLLIIIMIMIIIILTKTFSMRSWPESGPTNTLS